MRDTTEQQALRAAVRGLIATHQAQSGTAGGDLGLWQRLGREIGVAGLSVPERFCGAGGGPAEVHIAAEELGRALAGTPMLGSAVLATQLLLASGDEAACAAFLPAMAAGTAIAALAWTTAAGRWDTGEVACQATATAGGDWIVDGEAHYVLDGDRATVLLVPAVMPAGIGLLAVQPAQPAVTCRPCTTVDQTRRLAVVRLDGAVGRRVGTLAALAAARDAACIALSAEQAGAAARALEITVEYTKARVQFGRPIGSFQALQHRMADLHVLVQAARSVSYAAASALADEAADVPLRAATAKAYCSEALQRVSAEMIQLHGAIGMTWEHDAHRYFKRAHGDAELLGRPADHILRIAAAVIDG